MMVRNYLAAFAGMILMAVPWQASAGYRELKKEIDTYQPPAYVKSMGGSISADTKSVHVNDGFDAEKNKLQLAKKKWEESLEKNADASSFIIIPEKDLETLSKKAADNRASLELLGKNFSLHNLRMLTLLRNPIVKAAESRMKASLESYDQSWQLDDILVQYSAFTEAVMAGVGPMKGMKSTTMTFPFPGVLALKGEVAGQTVQAARESLEIARRDTVTEAAEIFWNLLFVIKSQGITQETLGLFKNLEAVAQSRYRSGVTSFQDVIKVNIRREMLAENLATLKETRGNLEIGILSLLNLPPDTALPPPVWESVSGQVPDLNPLYRTAVENRQELKRMRAMIGKMERMIEMAETMILPRFTLNLSVYDDQAVMKTGSAAMKPSFPQTTEVSRGAGLPKNPWFGKNDSFLRQTRQKLSALREDLKNAESMTRRMVRNAWSQLDDARREVRLYNGEIVSLSRSALDVSTTGYESGKVSFADVIGSYMEWLRARLTLERKKSDAAIALARLEKVIGKTLNRENKND